MKLIDIGRGFFTKVSDEDFEALSKFNWTLKTNKQRSFLYAKRFFIKPDGKYTTTTMHAQLMGFPPKGLEVDHINGDGLDNQRHNLRVCTKKENQRNQRKQKGCSSNFFGVFKAGKKWSAHITINDKVIHIGTFKDEIEAAKARDAKAIVLHGSFAKLNFITVPEPVSDREVKK